MKRLLANEDIQILDQFLLHEVHCPAPEEHSAVLFLKLVEDFLAILRDGGRRCDYAVLPVKVLNRLDSIFGAQNGGWAEQTGTVFDVPSRFGGKKTEHDTA